MPQTISQPPPFAGERQKDKGLPRPARSTRNKQVRRITITFPSFLPAANIVNSDGGQIEGARARKANNRRLPSLCCSTSFWESPVLVATEVRWSTSRCPYSSSPSSYLPFVNPQRVAVHRMAGGGTPNLPWNCCQTLFWELLVMASSRFSSNIFQIAKAISRKVWEALG